MKIETEKKVSETFPEMDVDKVKILAELLSDYETMIQIQDLIDVLKQSKQ